jgi:hypothetical protein
MALALASGSMRFSVQTRTGAVRPMSPKPSLSPEASSTTKSRPAVSGVKSETKKAMTATTVM